MWTIENCSVALGFVKFCKSNIILPKYYRRGPRDGAINYVAINVNPPARTPVNSMAKTVSIMMSNSAPLLRI